MADTKGFTFKIEKGVEIPAATINRATVHPFPWGDMKPGESFVIPKTYWTKQRGVNDADYSPTKYRERIRAHFRGWQEKDKKRAGLMLVMRTEGDDVRVWVQKAQ